MIAEVSNNIKINNELFISMFLYTGIRQHLSMDMSASHDSCKTFITINKSIWVCMSSDGTLNGAPCQG